MPLTPEDVEQTTFSTALRGYDLNEVDDFLDRVVASMRELEEELADTKSRPTEHGNGGASEGPDESAVGRALVAAQQTADKILEVAGAEANQILEDARTAADVFEDERDAHRAAAEAEMEQLGERVAALKIQLALLAAEVADRLDQMGLAIGGVMEGGADAQPMDIAGGDIAEEGPEGSGAEEEVDLDAVDAGTSEDGPVGGDHDDDAKLHDQLI